MWSATRDTPGLYNQLDLAPRPGCKEEVIRTPTRGIARCARSTPGYRPCTAPRCIAVPIVLLALLLLPLSAFAEYRTFELESLRITYDSDWPQSGASGYYPVRFDITNLGEAREIEITSSAQHWFDPRRGRRTAFGGMEMGRADVRQRVRLKPGDRVKITITLPVFADNENFQFRLRENGDFLEGFNTHVSFQSGRVAAESPVLVATSSSSPLGLEAAGWLRPIPPSRGYYYGPTGGFVGAAPGRPGASVPRLDYILEPERLPENWLGFTSLRAVLLGPAEWAQLRPAQQDALLAWTASGGDLLFMDGPLQTLLPPGQNPVGLGGSGSMLPYYLGNIHLLTSADIRAKGFEPTIRDLDSAAPDWGLPAVRARDWGWVNERGFRLPIEGAANVPTRSYLVILALFIAVIGPVNYIYLWRKKLQVLMVLTVPLLSFIFIVLVTGYGLLSEGFDVRSRAVTFTLLDQNSKKAATRSSVSLYPGGITPGAGVRFASDVAVFPLGTDGLGARGQMVLDLTGEQRFQSGLLQARTPGNFEEISFQPARQRLNFEHNGNDLSVVNGLGAAIEHLYYREDGKVYVLKSGLPAGERASLDLGKPAAIALIGETLKTTPLVVAKFQQLLDRQPDGAYVAVLEKSPFWDAGVAETAEAKSFHLVLGFAGGQP